MLITTHYSFSKNKRMFRLLEAHTFEVGGKPHTVPKGHEFDGATIPRPLWWLFSPTGKAFEAACLHDWFYINNLHHPYTRSEVDRIFSAHLRQDRVPDIQVRLFYGYVRVLAWWKWVMYKKS